MLDLHDLPHGAPVDQRLQTGQIRRREVDQKIVEDVGLPDGPSGQICLAQNVVRLFHSRKQRAVPDHAHGAQDAHNLEVEARRRLRIGCRIARPGLRRDRVAQSQAIGTGDLGPDHRLVVGHSPLPLLQHRRLAGIRPV